MNWNQSYLRKKRLGLVLWEPFHAAAVRNSHCSCSNGADIPANLQAVIKFLSVFIYVVERGGERGTLR
jgi:hypothetical protein